MGFGYFMYSHSLVPVIDLLVRVVTNLVSERKISLLNFKLMFCVSITTAVLGCQLSVLSSWLPVFCVVSVLLSCLNLVWFVFYE